MRRRLAASLLVLAAALLPAGLAAEPTISLQWTSTTGTGTPGGDTMDVSVGDVVALNAFVEPEVGASVTFAGFSLAFDPDVLQANAAVECPGPDSTPPGSNHPSFPGSCVDYETFRLLAPLLGIVTIDNPLGAVLGFDAATGTTPGAEGPLDVAAVELEVVGTPGAGTSVEVFYQPGLGSVNDGDGGYFFPTASATLLPEPAIGSGLAAGVLALLALRRRRASTLAVVCVFGLVLAAGSGVARAQDADGDGVLDAADNCLLTPNAPPLDCDTDQDGYGNACDTDYNQDGFGGGSLDYAFFAGAYGDTGPDIADHDCDDIVGGPDHAKWIERFGAAPVGPSGLACAGSVPCP